MNSDIIEKIGSSIIQHGKLSNRVYIMKLVEEDFEKVIKKTEELCSKNGYTKIFAKVPENLYKQLSKKEFRLEAKIPNYYLDRRNCVFLAKYLDKNREQILNIDLLDNVLKLSNEKKKLKKLPKLSKEYEITTLNKSHTEEMSRVYAAVFESYPFPIFDPSYLSKTMDENIKYAGIMHNSKLVAIASAETSPEYKNSEMTDFATLPEYRGENLALHLLNFLENMLKSENYKTLYTIARAKSFGMNMTFKKSGYWFSGTLKNNTQISGNIESMNVWYKCLG